MAEEAKTKATRPARKVKPGEYGILKMEPDEIRSEEWAMNEYLKELMNKGDPAMVPETLTAMSDLLEDWGFEKLAGMLRYLASY